MKLSKPANIKNDEFKSAKWDEITDGREFKQSDAPTLALLCQWYAVVEQCISDITLDGEVRVAYANSMNDIKAMPQLATMKQASAEIRAINKQLGISDGVDEVKKKVDPRFILIQNNRAKRAKAAANA